MGTLSERIAILSHVVHYSSPDGSTNVVARHASFAHIDFITVVSHLNYSNNQRKTWNCRVKLLCIVFFLKNTANATFRLADN